MKETKLPEYRQDFEMVFDIGCALMRVHYRIEPLDLLEEGADGEISYEKFARWWSDLEFVLDFERKTNLKIAGR